ncbi:PEP-CTERM sorting domain-containing protein [Nitrosospira briensis]|uniref:PEP-CTERM sorting domain-containing protein n=1 Tax=Nitrosospira briensis TaxID=35799 RepID=UPI0008E744A3|nr:PEP-CTERM sorting domain-containing protein [Nitrosospira briensis]SFO33055.1 PEP-CTERM protein-sorting domain-containing protein [Nitrosospira briensis]
MKKIYFAQPSFLKNLSSMLFLAILTFISAPSPAALITYSTMESMFDSFALNQGWWSTTRGGSNENGNDAYSTGEFQDESVRGFFTFDLSSLSGTVTSATLRVMRGGGSNNTDEIQLSLWDVTTPASTLNHNEGYNSAIVDDLGSGINYGFFSIPSGSYSDYLLLPLNSNALGDINATSGFFSIGAMTGAVNQSIFGATRTGFSNAKGELIGDPKIVYLDLITDSVVSINEPTTSMLLGLGILCLGVSRRRKKSNEVCR